MNNAFTKLSRIDPLNSGCNRSSSEKSDFTNVHVNVVGNWSNKNNPSITVNINKKPEESKTTTNNATSEKPRRLKSFNLYLTNEDNVDSVNEYNDDLPDKIEGSYKYDFNIMKIHDLILKRFNKQKEHDIKILQQEKKREEVKLKEKQNMVERKATLKEIQKIQKKIDNIVNDKDFKKYINKIEPLINEYNIMGTLSKIVSFVSNKKKDTDSSEEEDVPEDETTQYKRHGLIFDFLEEARKYIDVDLVREVREGNKCMSCGHKLNDVETDVDDEGIIVCPNCGIERIIVVRSRFYTDNTRTNNSGNNYEDRANFEKVLMRYQGKQPDKPPPDLYNTLEKYFQKKRLPVVKLDGEYKYVSSSYIRDHFPLNEEGEKEGTGRSLMYTALKETNNSGYYDHINIILNEMWGWSLPNISHLEDRIMEDYDKSQRIYEMIPKNRKSSLNSQFRLFKHLRLLDYPCKARDFRIPTTHDIYEFHQNMWAKICDILGWEKK